MRNESMRNELVMKGVICLAVFFLVSAIAIGGDLEIVYPVGDPYVNPADQPDTNGYTVTLGFLGEVTRYDDAGNAYIELHSGVDTDRKSDSQTSAVVRAIMEGKVHAIRRELKSDDESKPPYWNGGWGVSIIISHTIGGMTWYELHAHMDPSGPVMSLQVGSSIYAGQHIGNLGSTGRSTSPHVHSEGKFASSFGFGYYLADDTRLDDFFDILEYIKANQDSAIKGIGYFADGWNHDGSSQAIFEAWGKNGGRAVLGIKHDNFSGTTLVHDWYGLFVQDTKNWDTGNDFILIYNSDMKRAFIIKEGFRWFFTTQVVGPQELGAPRSDEITMTSGAVFQSYHKGVLYWGGSAGDPIEMYSRQNFESTFGISLSAEEESGFTIAIVPGNGESFDLVVYAQSPYSIYLTINRILGAERYEAHMDGAKVGDLVDFSYSVNGILPNSAHEIEVVAIGQSGDEIARSETVIVTTPSESAHTVPLLDLTYWVRGNKIELGVPKPNGASYATVWIDGATYNVQPGTFWFTPALSDGSHDIQILVYSAHNVLLGQTNLLHITTGQQFETISNGPGIINPNEPYEIAFTFYNNSDFPVRLTKYRIAEASINYMTLPFSTFPDPGEIPAHSSVEIVVPFTTADYYLALGEVAIAIYAESDALPSGIRAVCHAIHEMRPAEFIDLSCRLKVDPPDFLEGEMARVAVRVDNPANSTAPPAVLELRVDGILMSSILTPEIGPNQTWEMDLPIGNHSAGNHELELEIDPRDEIPEPYEDNNSAHYIFEVTPAPNADLIVSDLRFDPAQPRSPGDLRVHGSARNAGGAASDPAELRVEFNGQTKYVLIPSILSGGVHEFGVLFSLVDEDGQYAILMTIDPENLIEESDETNNSTGIPVTVLPAEHPDMVSSISWEPADPVLIVGKSYSLRMKSKNIGNGAAKAFVSQFRLGGESNPARYSVAGLAPNESVEFVRSFAPTRVLRFGFTATSDIDDNLVEEDESNNEFLLVLDSKRLFADLVVSDISFEPLEPYYDEQFEVLVRIGNIDEGTSEPGRIKIELGTQVYSVEFSALAPGEIHVENVAVVVEDRSADPIPVVVTVDSDGVTEEIDETNNRQYAAVEIRERPLPNLKLSDLELSNGPHYVGRELEILGLVGNDGTGPSDPSELRIRFGTKIVMVPVPELQPAETYDFSTKFNLVIAGDFDVELDLDTENLIAESDESDNSFSGLVTILPDPEDEVVTFVIPQVSDTMISRDYNDACGSPDDQLRATIGASTRKNIQRYSRSLLDFDFSFLPAGAKIESARLELYRLDQSEYMGNTFYLNLLTDPYDKDLVTWCQRTSLQQWVSPGGSWTSLGESSVFIPSYYGGGWHYQSGDIGDWIAWDVTEMLQAVANRSHDFNGILLRQEDIVNGSENQGVNFASMDHPDAVLRPKLIVTYLDDGDAEVDVLIDESFENGVPVDWKVGGTGNTPLVDTRDSLYEGKLPTRGIKALFVGDSTDGGYVNTWVEKMIDLSGYEWAQLDLDLLTHSLFGAEFIAVKIWDGQWHTLTTYQESEWRHFSFDLSAFDLNSEFIVRIESYMNYRERLDASYADAIELIAGSEPVAPGTAVIREDFEGGLENWQINLGGDGFTPVVHIEDAPYALTPVSGNQVLFLGNAESQSFATSTADLVLDLEAASQATLKFHWATYKLESATDFLALDIYDGQWHYEVEKLQNYTTDPNWLIVNHDLSQYDLIDGFKIRFRSYMNWFASSDSAYVDALEVSYE